MSVTTAPIPAENLKRYCLFPAYSTDHWRVICKVSLAQAVAHEARGAWKRVFDPVSAELIGFQLVAPDEKRVDADVRSIHTTAAISCAEMERNTELSRTAGLPETYRLERMAQHRAPEDAVERVQAKVRVYAVLGAAKGDILRVWPK